MIDEVVGWSSFKKSLLWPMNFDCFNVLKPVRLFLFIYGKSLLHSSFSIKANLPLNQILVAHLAKFLLHSSSYFMGKQVSFDAKIIVATFFFFIHDISKAVTQRFLYCSVALTGKGIFWFLKFLWYLCETSIRCSIFV